MVAGQHFRSCGCSTDPHPRSCGKTRLELSTASHKEKEDAVFVGRRSKDVHKQLRVGEYLSAFLDDISMVNTA